MAVTERHFQQLEKIKGWRQRAFVLSLAQRSLPNLLFGLDVLRIDCPQDMPLLVAALWQGLAEERLVSFAQPTHVLNGLLDNLAERDEYGARPAEDLVNLLLMAVELEQQPDLILAKEAGHLSLQTVIRHIEFSEGEGLEEHDLVMLLDRHPLVSNELAFQRDLQRCLRASGSLPTVLNAARNLAHNEGFSNIGLSLEN